MPQKANSKNFETFNDGILSVCEADERTLLKTKIENIRFGNRTVGVTRYWQAKTFGNKVSKLLSIPMEAAGVEIIETNDVVIIQNTGQYQILQVQIKFDSKPPAIYLSLEQIVHPYKDRRDTDGI